jgi:hypothetical protein
LQCHEKLTNSGLALINWLRMGSTNCSIVNTFHGQWNGDLLYIIDLVLKDEISFTVQYQFYKRNYMYHLINYILENQITVLLD